MKEGFDALIDRLMQAGFFLEQADSGARHDRAGAEPHEPKPVRGEQIARSPSQYSAEENGRIRD